MKKFSIVTLVLLGLFFGGCSLAFYFDSLFGHNMIQYIGFGLAVLCFLVAVGLRVRNGPGGEN